jgi:AcrR family transcriptional regulator
LSTATAPSAPTGADLARTPAQKARRERIVEAATDLLTRREYERIQVREVAEAADVALATLYRYFPSKEQLYANVLLTWSEAFDPGARTGGRAPASDRDRLRAALRHAVRAYERSPNFYRLISVLEIVPDPVVAELYARFATGFGDALHRTLPDTDPADADVVARAAGAMLGAVLKPWSRGTTSIDAVYRDLDRFVEVVFAGPRPAGVR